ncbi:MAG: hypothetical protein PSV17_03335 [Methylotenera sp.]|uniref:BRO family protein n=1 Tax=Methylotenera sp. TaxID=2051956 RepID=UPI00248810AE|nr:BRO family protein [Methylotenera sp.]MDI1308450.1 hypothetical protein [Methylotenera sp.]
MNPLKPTSQQQHHTFESIKHIDAEGNEFWYARALAKVLDYSDFRNFVTVIEKAKKACEQSNVEVSDHIGEVTEMVRIGSGAQRPMESYALSRNLSPTLIAQYQLQLPDKKLIQAKLQELLAHALDSQP